tara:strand:- start:1130 stop:1633 length:504 start_codon:yes stop_codon:yes gene_type:complete
MSDKKDVDTKISEALDLQPTNKDIVIEDKKSDLAINDNDSNQEEDYNLVRNNLKLIIETGQSAMEGILNVASEGESPRAYEVVSQLIKSVSDANKDLLDLHKKMKDLEKDVGTKQTAGSITNNAIYVGSTKDLQRLIKDSKVEADTIDASFEVIEDNEPESDISREP